MVAQRLLAVLLVAAAGGAYNAGATDVRGPPLPAEPTSTVAATATNASPEQVWGMYCCDAAMQRRCVLYSPQLIGSLCFCLGVDGIGYVCP